DSTGHYPHLLGFSGEDAGMSSYTLLAFALFGINVSSLSYAYFALVLLSVMLFAIAHRRNTGAMVAAASLSIGLYLIACSALLSFKLPAEFGFRPGIDFKDPRFLGTIAGMPLLHIIATWLRDDRMTVSDYVALTLQAMILAFALHLRFSVGWSLWVPLLLWTLSIKAAIAWRGPGSMQRLSQWRSPRSVLVLAIVCAMPAAAHLAISYSCHPFYTVEGDLPRHTFWDGVLQSLEYNPNWPAKHGALANYSTGDELPLAAVRIAIAKLPGDQQRQYLQPNGYPTRIAYVKFSKDIFMDILIRDPAFVAETFLVVKPLLILRTHEIMYRSLFAGLDSWRPLVLITVLAILGWIV